MNTPSASPHSIRFSTGLVTTDGTTSILDAALAQNVIVPFSCQRGECGSCRAVVTSGHFELMTAPTERSYVPAENELLMCQCRAMSDMTLQFAPWAAAGLVPQRRNTTVVSCMPLTADVTQLIVAVQGAEPFDYRPGQHIQVVLDDGQRRCFSIANAPLAEGPARLEFHIRHMPDGHFTHELLPRLTAGDELVLEGPFGSCIWPSEGWADDVEHLVLLATGTGFAGLSSIMLTAVELQAVKSVTLYWGNRASEDCYAERLLTTMQRKNTGFQWHEVLSSKLPDADVNMGGASSHGGQEQARNYVQDRAAAAAHDWAHSVVYACGNAEMIRAAREQLCALGLPPARFLSEAFTPAGNARHATADHPWEQVGHRFTMSGILDARQRSQAAVYEIAALIRPGMTTREAIQLADTHLRRRGSSHNWHPTYVRFGADTQSPVIQPTDFQRKLQKNDVFVLDIGPVWDGYEGDYGDTFVVGTDTGGARLAQAARDVFQLVRAAWLEGITGIALYDYAETVAREQACTLVRDIPGHRISDFPHALYGKHRLAHADFVPAEGIWVLEIQVRDMARPIGAFYEDVLLR